MLSRFNSLILARVFGHKDVTTLAKFSSVPVINALSDLHHPLQALADLLTLQEHFGVEKLEGKTVAWVGVRFYLPLFLLFPLPPSLPISCSFMYYAVK